MVGSYLLSTQGPGHHLPRLPRTGFLDTVINEFFSSNGWYLCHANSWSALEGVVSLAAIARVIFYRLAYSDCWRSALYERRNRITEMEANIFEIDWFCCLLKFSFARVSWSFLSYEPKNHRKVFWLHVSKRVSLDVHMSSLQSSVLFLAVVVATEFFSTGEDQIKKSFATEWLSHGSKEMVGFVRSIT